MAITPTHLPRVINGENRFPRLEAAPDSVGRRPSRNDLPGKAMVALCLDRCIAASRSTQAIYDSAASNTRDTRWRSILHDRANQRAAFVAELHAVLSSIGAYYKENERAQRDAVIVPLHGRRDDLRELVAACAREEVRALHAYDAAAADLVRMAAPVEIRAIVAAQREIIFGAERELEHIVGKTAVNGR